MTTLESFLVGRFEDTEKCEDLIIESERYIAVVDGATSKSDSTPVGVTPGKLIALCIENFFASTVRPLDSFTLISALSEYVERELLTESQNRWGDDPPSASIAIFSKNRLEITIVGDVSVVIDGVDYGIRETFDKAMAEARALFNTLWLHENCDMISTLKERDIGREAIMPFLKRQRFLINNTRYGKWNYGAINGTPVPPVFVRSLPVKSGQEIIFATDGYMEPKATLEESESALSKLLTLDPFRISFPSTKGVAQGATSFDDRAYIRFVA